MQTNKRAVESFIVAKNGTSLKTSGTLNNATTGAVELQDGQIGLVAVSALGSVAPYNFLAAAPVIGQAPLVSIFQGTKDSANPSQAQFKAKYPLAARPYEQSGVIDFRNNVTITKQPVLAPTTSAFVVGSMTAPIVVQDEIDYSVTIAFRGRGIQEMYSIEQAYAITEHFTTPDYTVAGIAEPVDHMLQNLSWLLNRNSYATAVAGRYPGKAPIITLLLSDAGGTAISAATAGTFLPLVNSTYGVRGITLDATQAAAIAKVGVESGFTNILTIDLATAGTTAGGEGKGLAFVSLDDQHFYIDTVPQSKIRLEVGLKAGFLASTFKKEVSFAFEGQGQGRALHIMYRNTAGQRKYEQIHEQFPVIEYPNPVNPELEYVVYNIVHGKFDHVDTGNILWHPRKELILVESTNTGLITALDSALNSIMSSSNNHAVLVQD